MIAPVRDLEPAVPAGVEAAVMHALAREPRFRPASAADFAHELAGSERATRRLPQRRFEGVSARRSGLWLAAAIAAAAIAVILGLAKLGGTRSSSPPPAPARVRPPARGQTATQEARNLARWLRAHSR